MAERFAADRPFVLTFAMLAATVAMLEFRRGLWLLPPLFLFWANCHGGVVLGWAALGAYCAEARDRKLWIAAAASILVSGLNPNGFRVADVLLTYSQSPMQSALWEWHRPALWPPEAFGILLFAGAAVLVWGGRRTRPVDWLLFAAFTAASLMAVRNVILIGFFAPVVIAAYFPWKRALPVAAEYAAAALLLAGIGAGIARGTTFQSGRRNGNILRVPPISC